MAALYLDKALQEPIEAAAHFYATDLPKIIAALAQKPSHLCLIFPTSENAHRAWRLAAMQSLARSHAPIRINGLAGNSKAALNAALSHLDHAPGITGQYLVVDESTAESA